MRAPKAIVLASPVSASKDHGWGTAGTRTRARSHPMAHDVQQAVQVADHGLHRGLGVLHREAGEGPCPRQSWFLRLPSRACLPRTVLFVTKDTHSWAFREITTVSLSWGQQRDVCKETLLSEKLNHPARQTEGRASARLLSQAPPKSRAPTAGHGERPSSDTPRGSRRTRHTTHLLTTPALIRLKPPQRALSWGTRGKGGKGPGGHRAGSEGWDARKGCSTRPLLMPLNFWEERSPQIT